MLRKLALTACAFALLCLPAPGISSTANADWIKRAQRQFDRSVRQDVRQSQRFHRQHDAWHRRNPVPRPYYGTPYRGYGWGVYSVPRNGYVVTPYFSIGF